MSQTFDPFQRRVPGIGRLAVRRCCPADDADVVHAWLSSDHAAFWGMQSQSRADVADYLQQIAEVDSHDAFIGLHNGRPAFFIETYSPAAEAVGGLYTVEAGDRGLHILVAPPTQRLPLFTWAVFALTMDVLFADVRVERVVVEPDIANHGIHGLNRRAGFVYERQIDLPDKSAWLATCTRRDHEQAMAQLTPEQASAAGLAAAFQGVPT